MFDCKKCRKGITVIQLYVKREFLELHKVVVVETSVTRRIICVVVSSEMQDGGLAAKCDFDV